MRGAKFSIVATPSMSARRSSSVGVRDDHQLRAPPQHLHAGDAQRGFDLARHRAALEPHDVRQHAVAPQARRELLLGANALTDDTKSSRRTRAAASGLMRARNANCGTYSCRSAPASASAVFQLSSTGPVSCTT